MTRHGAALDSPVHAPIQARLLIPLLLAVALAVGLFARFDGLGARQLAIDEFYTVRSVELILERGVPAFPDGGYYLRAPLLQYPMAAAALIFGADEFSYRLPAVLFGLLAVALSYLYARRFTSAPVALAVAIALLLSSWHVEFTRFARMYTLFQCTTLLFLIALDDVLAGVAGWRRYLPHLALVLGLLTHALAILLAPLLFLPLLLERRARFTPAWWRYGGVSLLVTLAGFALTQFDPRYLGVIDPVLPADYERPPGLHSPLTVPAFPFWQLPGDPWATLLLVLVAAAALTAGLLVLRRRGRAVTEVDIGAGLVVLFSLAHLLVPAGLVLLGLLLRYDLHRVGRHPPRVYALLGLAALLAAGWLGWALAAPAQLAVPEVTLRWDMAEAGLLKALWSTFFGWPDLYPAVIRPFAVELPVLGLLTVGALGLVMVVHRHDPLPALVRHPGFIVLYAVLLFGLVSPEWSTARYWFHLYPVLLCLIALAATTLARRLPARHATLAGALGFLLAFAITSDFNPRHLVQAGGTEVAFRLGAFAPFQLTWYPRVDYGSPAHFVEEQGAPAAADRVVVENLGPVSYYLDRPHAIYYSRRGQRFRITSRAGGTRELWSGMRLLSTPEELAVYTDAADTVWLIRAVERHPDLPEPEDVWGAERLCGLEQAFLSRDARIEVLRLTLC